ncbi:cytochrome o ubiquinol oxidase subunit IV [Paenibacillus lupini]|jgi:cytochrome o ubiquinol oxidase operon protein cyoD|uniref:cytochrome o ubiquinol oxidase subunit IV n=1 Tax=Paenibacillus lupini TaxID=1450204 RepID=UPI001420F8B6|nr:cytochrome o ubiquinol oxidase subunit IV [Paenibacillus lupini]NIK26811.1 cytochrome o ubiquinol oxidase operon protein cyoD [Paenibacillus lupini]
MANHNSHAHDEHESHGSLKSYVIGFVLSIVLTILPIVVVMNDMMDKTPTIIFILIMAVLQFVIQLFFFMHLREDKKPRYNVMALIFGLVILVTIIAGSIWIMTYNAVG